MSHLDLSPIGILSALLQILFILFSLSVHESAHAWMADKLGDSTGRMLGRITLNPIPHIDLIGTILLPLVLAVTGAPVFGWAKPVPVISRNFKNIRRDEALVGAAGPLSNLLLTMVTTVVLGGLLLASSPEVFFQEMAQPYTAQGWVFRLALINLVLAAFNLIPIPPLDGSWILSAILPAGVHRFYEGMRRLGPILLLILFMTPLLDLLLTPILRILAGVFILLPLHVLGMAAGS
jgi:Zn-dependent protease